MHEIAEPRDEGGRSLLVSALLHACVIGLFFLAPPGTPALSLDETHAEPLRTHLLASISGSGWTSSSGSTSISGSSSTPISGSISGSTSTSTSRSPLPSRSRSTSRSPSPSPSPSRSPSPDPLGSLAALALALDAAASPAFVAEDALAQLGPNVDVGHDGFDMVGTGRGTGGGGDTIGAPRASAWGTAGISATCSGPELEARTARMGRIAAVESCAAANTPGGMLAAGFGTRTGASRRAPDAIDGSPRRGRIFTCSATCDADVRGSLSRDVVRSVVSRHRAEIRACYERALVARPDLEGRVTAAFQIAPTGRVQASAIDAQRSDLHANAVETCVAQAVGRWTFPSSGGPTLVSYPFVLGTD